MGLRDEINQQTEADVLNRKAKKRKEELLAANQAIELKAKKEAYRPIFEKKKEILNQVIQESNIFSIMKEAFDIIKEANSLRDDQLELIIDDSESLRFRIKILGGFNEKKMTRDSTKDSLHIDLSVNFDFKKYHDQEDLDNRGLREKHPDGEVPCIRIVRGGNFAISDNFTLYNESEEISSLLTERIALRIRENSYAEFTVGKPKDNRDYNWPL